MGKFLLQIIAQAKEFFNNLGPTKRISLIVSLIIVFIGLFVVSINVLTKEYGLLLSNIPSEQLPTIISKLNEKKVPYKMGEDQSSIYVPKDLLPATQMSLMAELGSAKIGVVGFEIFDKQDYTASSYTQKINYQRALQGELTRAINTLTAVKQSKVLLAIPQKKNFLEETGTPSASVVVELHPNKTLSPEQVKGIQYLVASSVEGMLPEKVTVVDERGRMLSKPDDNELGQTTTILDLKKKIENEFEERINAIIAKIVGQGKVITKVDVTIGHKVTQMVEELYDPERTALRSQQSEEESLDGSRQQPVGVPGVQSNAPNVESNGSVASLGFKQDVKREIKTSNYEISKTVKNIKELAGQLEKISVAVVVDGISREVTDQTGKTKLEWVPRSEEELRRFESLIKTAIGYNEKRGDSVKVETMPFAEEDFSKTEKLITALEMKNLLSSLFRWGSVAAALVLLFFVVVRPFMSWVTDSLQQSVDEILPRTIEELEELHSVDTALPGISSALPVLDQAIDPEKAEAELLRDKIMSIVESDAEKASGALSLWLAKRE
ncbi:MAG: flagellar basal-body MS-ring/collar protein FliF [Pseudobdellovibrionaceae bacterium]|nr:flagellar basal-body MS-ring/collar protein FliF [Pseudobdellovibrionaceae bacterium]